MGRGRWTVLRGILTAAAMLVLATTWAPSPAGATPPPRLPLPPSATNTPPPSPAEVPPISYGFQPLSPTRMLDTRIGLGAAKAPVGAGASIDLQVSGIGGVPATGAGAVVLNVTGVEPSTATFVTVYPTGGAVPVGSNLNLGPGEIKPNLVVAKVGAGGKVSLYNSNGTTNLIADVTGWLPIGESYTGLAPVRLLDTRTGNGAQKAPVGSGMSIDLTVTGRGGVPADDVGAVVLNITGVEPAANTFVTVYPTGEPLPVASNLNLAAREIKPNLVIAKVGAGGKVSLYNSNGSTNLLADVMGWLPKGGSYEALSPTRVLDTRVGNGAPVAPVGTGQAIDLAVTGKAGVPTKGVGAVVLNVTGVEPSTGTFLTVYPTGETVPVASNLNLAPGEIKPNLVVAKVGAGGRVSIFNNSGKVHVIADVMGWMPLPTLVDADTIAFTGHELDPVTAVTATSVTVSTLSGPWAQVHVGSVLAGGVSTGSPTGFLSRVTAMSGTGPVTFTTVPAALDEAIADGELHATFGGSEPPSAPGADAPSIGVGFAQSQSFMAEETVSGPHGSASVTANGEVGVGASAELDVDIDYFPPGIKAEFSASANESASGTVTLSGEAQWEKTWDLGEWEFGTYTFAVGPVPVVVQPQLELGAHASASAAGKAEVGFTQTGSVTAGIRYDDGFDTFEDHDFQGPSIVGPTIEAEASVSIGVDASAEVEFYGAAEAGLTLTPHLDLDADLCKAELSWALDASASFELEISHVIDKEKNVPLGELAGGTLAKFAMPTAINRCRPWSGQIEIDREVRGQGVSGSMKYKIPPGALPSPALPSHHEFADIDISVDLELFETHDFGHQAPGSNQNCRALTTGSVSGPAALVGERPGLLINFDGTVWTIGTTGPNTTHVTIPYTTTFTPLGGPGTFGPCPPAVSGELSNVYTTFFAESSSGEDATTISNAVDSDGGSVDVDFQRPHL